MQYWIIKGKVNRGQCIQALEDIQKVTMMEFYVSRERIEGIKSAK